MTIRIYNTIAEMAKAAAAAAACELSERIAQKGHVTFMAATGTSQLDFLEALCREPGVDWSKTTMFHLDEYIGLPEDHPASFRRYLRERLIDRVQPGTVHLIRGDIDDPADECRRLAEVISGTTIDVAFVGIGENAHLAFNDPPADFDTEAPYIVVELDETCRRQQMGEGWFPGLEDVPRRAISMSIRQIMKSQAIVCIVPDKRKAQAVQTCLEEEISPWHPASILREHSHVFMYLDEDSASLLKKKP